MQRTWAGFGSNVATQAVRIGSAWARADGKRLWQQETGEPVSAKEALRIGLVNRLSRPEELLRDCLALAEQISRNAPLAVKYAMETINHGGKLSLEDGLRLESVFFGLCFATKDVEEGTKAFLEKRPPVFTGQ